MKNLKMRCTNSQMYRDGYFPSASFKLTAKLDDNIFIYDYEHNRANGEINGLKLVSIQASDLDIEKEVRALASKRMMQYYRRLEAIYNKEVEAGLYN